MTETNVSAQGHALSPLVHKLLRLGDLSSDDLAAVRALPYHVRPVKHRNVLLHVGHSPDHCTLLLSGLAMRERTTRQGARQFVGLYVTGDFVDLNSGLIGCAHDTVQAIGPARIACIPLDMLTQLAFDRPAIGRLLWIDTLLEASIAREWTVNVGRRNARTRLLHLICEIAVRQEQAGLGDRAEVTLPLTQEHLGDAVGLTAVHVNRVLRSLSDIPAIERHGRTLKIRDWQALTRLADFQEDYLTTPDLVAREGGPLRESRRDRRKYLG